MPDSFHAELGSLNPDFLENIRESHPRLELGDRHRCPFHIRVVRGPSGKKSGVIIGLWTPILRRVRSIPIHGEDLDFSWICAEGNGWFVAEKTGVIGV